MADNNIKDDSTIDLSNAGDILLSEDELLGTGAGTGGNAGAANTGSTPAATSVKKPVAGGAKYNIPAVVQEKYPDLVALILETESMDDEEREYWFQILPIMTPDQVKKFRDILISEKEQLAKLDEEYEAELAKINQKHVSQWQEFETKEEKKKREAQEIVQEKEEESLETDLLNKLQNL